MKFIRRFGLKKIGYLVTFAVTFVLVINMCAPAIQSRELVSSKANIKRATATLADSSRQISPDLMCFNVNTTLVESWSDEQFSDAVKQLNPKLLRIPGGTVASYWDWRKGGIIDDISSLPEGLPRFLRFKARRYDAGTLSEFKAGLQATNTTPIFVLNLLTSDLESQLEMLRSARDLGMPIKYVELGNELYFNIKNYKKFFPKPKDYAEVASEWTSAIKKEFPNAEIAVLGIVPIPEKPPRLQDWHRHLFEDPNLTPADAVTLHMYTGHGLDDNKSYKSYPYFTGKDVPIILGEPFREWQAMREREAFKLIPDDRKIWLTEYNLMDKGVANTRGQKYKVIGSWAHGLYTMAMSLAFLEEPRVEIMCNHVLIGNSRFAAILADEKSLLDPENDKTSATPLSLSASGSALQLLVDATTGMSTAHQINFSDNINLKGKDDFRYPAVTGWMFNNNNRSKAVILNLSGREFRIDLSGLFEENANYEQVSGNPRTLVGDPQALDRNTGQIKSSIVLPGHSVTKIAN